MGALLKEESTITAKGQTTVPKAVRKALGVDYGGGERPVIRLSIASLNFWRTTWPSTPAGPLSRCPQACVIA